MNKFILAISVAATIFLGACSHTGSSGMSLNHPCVWHNGGVFGNCSGE